MYIKTTIIVKRIPKSVSAVRTKTISNHIVEHFDSIGRKPDEHIISILFKKKITYKYNNKRLQSLYTNTCGLFCLFYSYYSARNEDMITVLDRFGDTYKENEFIVIKFYTDYFKKNSKLQ